MQHIKAFSEKEEKGEEKEGLSLTAEAPEDPNPTQQRLLESWRKLGGEGEKDDIQRHIL